MVQRYIGFLVNAILFGYILKNFLDNDPGKAISFGGVLLLLAAVATLFVQSANENENKDAAMTMNGGGH